MLKLSGLKSKVYMACPVLLSKVATSYM